MKNKLFLISFFALFSNMANANDYSASDVMRFCSNYSKVTEQIMTARQGNISKESSMSKYVAVEKSSENRRKEITRVVNQAYSQPIQKNDTAKYGVIKRFRDKNMMKCLGNHYAVR